MPRVAISAQNFAMPFLCTCCGGAPNMSIAAAWTRTTGGRVRRSETHKVQFPICANCQRHCDSEPRAWVYVGSAIVVSLFVVAFSGLVPLAIAIAVVSRGLFVARRSFARAMRSPACEAVHCPVRLEGWHGTEHWFLFDSRRFAGAFASANQAAGKNVLRVALDGSPTAPQPGPARTTAATTYLAFFLFCVLACVGSLLMGRSPPSSQGTLAPPHFETTPSPAPTRERQPGSRVSEPTPAAVPGQEDPRPDAPAAARHRRHHRGG